MGSNPFDAFGLIVLGIIVVGVSYLIYSCCCLCWRKSADVIQGRNRIPPASPGQRRSSSPRHQRAAPRRKDESATAVRSPITPRIAQVHRELQNAYCATRAEGRAAFDVAIIQEISTKIKRDGHWKAFKCKHIITLGDEPGHGSWSAAHWGDYLKDNCLAHRPINSIISIQEDEDIFWDFNPLDSDQFTGTNLRGRLFKSGRKRMIYNMTGSGNSFRVYRENKYYVVGLMPVTYYGGRGGVLWVPIHFEKRCESNTLNLQRSVRIH